MDMMEYRHKAMAYLGPLPAFSTLAGEEEIYGIGSEGAPVKVWKDLKSDLVDFHRAQYFLYFGGELS